MEVSDLNALIGADPSVVAGYSLGQAEVRLRVLIPVLEQVGSGLIQPKKWAEVFPETSLDAASEWDCLAHDAGADMNVPRVGTADLHSAREVSRLIEESSGPNQECFFARWSGYATSDGINHPAPILTSTIHGYSMNVYRTRLDSLFDPEMWDPDRLPNFWWATDASWMLGAGLYWDYFLFSGSRTLASQLLHSPELEAFPIAPGRRLPAPRGEGSQCA